MNTRFVAHGAWLLKTGFFRSACILVLFPLLMSACAANYPKMTLAGEDRDHYVVLLHGLARTERSMVKMQKALAQQGYGTCNISYPSTRYPIETLLDEYVLPSLKSCELPESVKISFVTHSMGGIIVRLMLEKTRMDNLGSVIMLSPPNRGSEIVDRLGNTWLFNIINGPAGNELGTSMDSLPNKLGPATFTTGIITGNRSINLILSSIIPGDDDGKVSVERAKLEGMTDFLVVPRSHPFIMQSNDVIEQVMHFLEYGRFRGSEYNPDTRKPTKPSQ